jgi:hypothetical protein
MKRKREFSQKRKNKKLRNNFEIFKHAAAKEKVPGPTVRLF